MEVFCPESKLICRDGEVIPQGDKTYTCRCWDSKIGCTLTAIDNNTLTEAGETREMRNQFGSMFGKKQLKIKGKDIFDQ